jgi:hypothetical protein
VPYPKEHSARVRDPGDFQEGSFRRKDLGGGVSIVLGRLKGETTMTAQAYRFDKDKFSAEEARAWLKKHDVEYISFEAASDEKAFDCSVKITGKTDEIATVAGYGVVFGGVDLEGDTFTKGTDFMLDLVPVKLVFYDHTLGDVKHVIGKAMAKLDDYGIWVEAQIERAKEYAEYVLDLVEKGLLGWSSGSVGHLIQRDKKSITRWPIVEFSLTPTPAEPRTVGVELMKSLLSAANIKVPEALAEASEDAPARDEDVVCDADTVTRLLLQ